ncbi:hypothetical protein [Aquicella lusitana]|uniref:Uncharacterized protein n=1 Tax=Aquicella lusitana TaxID=254246 RepID=A0A370GD07_9COXI|nr:hypothetical protein [Aquicella lusitana]RDI41705.1 hypothetical protein C8D86_11828 [Aquicella lusitana]VVC72681.1 hypothetical protein AQULUS_03950 [Aquicella lusitana]
MWCGKCKRSGSLCPVSFGLAWGIVIGLFMAGYAWIAWLSGYGTAVVDQYAVFYYGYEATFLGGIIGGFWGLVVGFLFGFFIALFYDLIACCCKAKCCKPSEGSDECCKPSDK